MSGRLRDRLRSSDSKCSASRGLVDPLVRGRRFVPVGAVFGRCCVASSATSLASRGGRRPSSGAPVVAERCQLFGCLLVSEFMRRWSAGQDSGWVKSLRALQARATEGDLAGSSPVSTSSGTGTGTGTGLRACAIPKGTVTDALGDALVTRYAPVRHGVVPVAGVS